MTSLHVICGLGPPNQKSWLRLWLQKRLVDRAVRVKANKSKIRKCKTANQDLML